MKRIGLNLLWLVPGVVGGSEEYTTRLLDALADQPPQDVEFVVFGNSLVFRSYPSLEQRFECVEAPVSGRSKALRVAAENTWLASQTRRKDIDLMHHLGGIMPFVRTCPSMLTIHDLQPLVMPEHFALTKRWFARFSIPPSARNALAIVTLTEVTRTMLVERLGVPSDRTAVIHAGTRPPDNAEIQAEKDLPVRKEYDLGDRPLFLYPAITYPHKNHLFLIEAFAPVARARPDALLVLTGGGAQMEEPLRESIRRLGITGQVRRLGRIPRLHLDALYHEATALLFPSRFEGFGIPVLEAMSRGCPVLAADATALPEVGGDAAVLLPLGDASRWSDEMLRLLGDPGWRDELSRAGRRRAAEFDWPSVAVQFGDVYHRVLDSMN